MFIAQNFHDEIESQNAPRETISKSCVAAAAVVELEKNGK